MRLATHRNWAPCCPKLTRRGAAWAPEVTLTNHIPAHGLNEHGTSYSTDQLMQRVLNIRWQSATVWCVMKKTIAFYWSLQEGNQPTSLQASVLTSKKDYHQLQCVICLSAMCSNITTVWHCQYEWLQVWLKTCTMLCPNCFTVAIKTSYWQPIPSE